MAANPSIGNLNVTMNAPQIQKVVTAGRATESCCAKYSKDTKNTLGSLRISTPAFSQLGPKGRKRIRGGAPTRLLRRIEGPLREAFDDEETIATSVRGL